MENRSQVGVGYRGQKVGATAVGAGIGMKIGSGGEQCGAVGFYDTGSTGFAGGSGACDIRDCPKVGLPGGWGDGASDVAAFG